jgi:hypothetical protein
MNIKGRSTSSEEAPEYFGAKRRLSLKNENIMCDTMAMHCSYPGLGRWERFVQLQNSFVFVVNCLAFKLFSFKITNIFVCRQWPNT